MRKKKISKGIILTIYCVCMFFVSLILLGALMNRGNTDMTEEMRHASFPLVSFVYDGKMMNTLHGYSQEMDIAYLRDTITPLMEGRNVSLKIDTYGTGIDKISYEVRTLDTKRLIEDSQVFNYVTNENVITADFTVKDLIDEHKEYSLCIILQTGNGHQIRYYTRIIEADDYRVSEKLNYVYYFNSTTFDPYTASNELPTYLESNSQGDNTTLHKVNIHSSLKQVTWAGLNVTPITEPVAMIREISEDIANIKIQYYVSVPDGEKNISYAIEEYYRIRHGEDRFYLLDFERTMDQIFDLDTATIANNKIVLGITDDNVQIKESSDGNRLAFVNKGRLYSYNVTDNKISEVFGFYGEDVTDLRESYQGSDIEIFQIDETGNIYFMVYGYMNRGIHEGEMGIAIYYYDSVLNTVEEQIFVSYTKSFKLLQQDIEQLAYTNSSNECYLYLNHAVYRFNLAEKTSEQLVSGLAQGAFVSSDHQQIIAWASGGDLNNATQIVLYDLTTGRQSNIEAEENSRIKPLGFFGEDLIYGVARKDDIIQDITGKMLYPMYTVIIRDIRGNILKQYEEPGIYIVDAKVEDNMITLTRMKHTGGSEGWSYTTSDQILNNDTEVVRRNTIEAVITETYERIVQIAVKKEINVDTLQILEPKQVIYEGDRTVELDGGIFEANQYYLYIKGELAAVYAHLPDAVREAYQNGGVVVDDYGNYLYRKVSRQTRNQIMAVESRKAEEDGGELAVCLDVILALEGYTVETAPLLARGQTPEEILEDTVDGITVLDLNGCKLDIVLYYVANEIPVLARLADGSAVLVVGYNEYQIVIMNPQTGTTYKISFNEANRWFENNGNWFIAYGIF